MVLRTDQKNRLPDYYCIGYDHQDSGFFECKLRKGAKSLLEVIESWEKSQPVQYQRAKDIDEFIPVYIVTKINGYLTIGRISDV